MTPGQIRLVRNSYTKIEPIAAQVGGIFYGKLFRMSPETRRLFGDDMSHQHAKFMSVVQELVSLHLRSLISLPVTLLNNSEAALPAIHSLGTRHIDFGVVPAHFDLMRTALLDTFSEVLGADFTPELRDAWGEAFDMMANTMKKGLAKTRSASPGFLDRLSDNPAAETQAREYFTAPPQEASAPLPESTFTPQREVAPPTGPAPAPEPRRSRFRTGFLQRLLRRA